jgi:hypothetical protein
MIPLLAFIELNRGPYRTGQYLVTLHAHGKLRDCLDDMGRWPSCFAETWGVVDDFGDLVFVTGWR